MHSPPIKIQFSCNCDNHIHKFLYLVSEMIEVNKILQWYMYYEFMIRHQLICNSNDDMNIDRINIKMQHDSENLQSNIFN